MRLLLIDLLIIAALVHLGVPVWLLVVLFIAHALWSVFAAVVEATPVTPEVRRAAQARAEARRESALVTARRDAVRAHVFGNAPKPFDYDANTPKNWRS